MGNFSDKIKIFYLTAVILFAMGVFAYLLDSWGVINLENYIPGLSEEAPIVADDADSPGELEWEQLEKERQRIEEERLALEEARLELERGRAELEAEREAFEQEKQALVEERQQFEESRQIHADRERMIANMANRLTSMPPQAAVSIAAGWSNSDLVAVFRQIDRKSVV